MRIALDGLAPQGGEPHMRFIRALSTGLTLRRRWLAQPMADLVGAEHPCMTMKFTTPRRGSEAAAGPQHAPCVTRYNPQSSMVALPSMRTRPSSPVMVQVGAVEDDLGVP